MKKNINIFVVILILLFFNCMVMNIDEEIEDLLNLNDENIVIPQKNTIPYILNITPEINGFFGLNTNVITIEYSKNVMNAKNIGNYILSGTGIGTFSIDSISENSSTSFTLNLNGQTGNGEIILDINPDNIIDEDGDKLSGQTSFSFTGDAVSPFIQLTDPVNLSDVGNNFKYIDITFSEEIKNYNDDTLYNISGPGAASVSIQSIESLTSNQYRINFDGSVNIGNIDIVVSDDIIDRAGNKLTGNRAFSFDSDIENPYIDMILPATLTTTVVTNINAIILIYSEAVKNHRNSSSYIFSGPGLGSLKILNIPGNDTNAILQMTGNLGEGKVYMDIINVADMHGNSLDDPTRFEFDVDGVAPTVISSTPDTSTIINDSFSQLEIEFSEPVKNADQITSYTPGGPAVGNLSVDNVTIISPTRFLITFTGIIDDNENQLIISMDNIQDNAGNTVSPSTLIFTVDN